MWPFFQPQLIYWCKYTKNKTEWCISIIPFIFLNIEKQSRKDTGKKRGSFSTPRDRGTEAQGKKRL